jgi:Saccharopine dehydrogenase C-terminal domain/Saccharopine dehydrogenase NADP binding domain
MPESLAASGTVHWIGTGLSTGSGLRVLCDTAKEVTLWARTTGKASGCLRRLGLTGRAETAEFGLAALRAAVRPGDVVISMLPAGEHAGLLELCLAARAHFACTSYTSQALADGAAAAREAGTVVLTEAGLDPGIDHVLAHDLVSSARAAVGDGPATAEFSSYCGGLPAVPNEFRYRFSWAPRGVLSALCEPARYVAEGQAREATRPWQATRPHRVAGEMFEAYPNRDSIPFIAQYGLPPAWHLRTFVRGTLRLDGWLAAWAPVFAELATGDARRISALAAELAARYPATSEDLDRVVLAVSLAVQPDRGAAWSGEYVLDVTGHPAESAMARCVSLPLAFGITEILAGRMSPGLHRAAEEPGEVTRWLAFLAGQGLSATRSQAGPAGPAGQP